MHLQQYIWTTNHTVHIRVPLIHTCIGKDKQSIEIEGAVMQSGDFKFVPAFLLQDVLAANFRSSPNKNNGKALATAQVCMAILLSGSHIRICVENLSNIYGSLYVERT
ncbi:hypothetical protein ACJX0J_022102, partial [Zea mays]